MLAPAGDGFLDDQAVMMATKQLKMGENLALLVMVALLAGCAGRGPRLFPVVPVETRALPAGGADRLYDTTGDGRADRAERLNDAGLVTVLQYDTTNDATFDLQVNLLSIPGSQRRHLIIIVDSVPFSMVHDLWRQGRFRLFAPPVRVISPFPVMTDVALAEFFAMSPCPGVEAEYYTDQGLCNAYRSYLGEKNAIWTKQTDYRLRPIAHTLAYLDPQAWYDHELRRIQDLYDRSDRRTTVGYVVSPSGLGGRSGRNGHQAGLIELDRLCQSIMFSSQGRVHITLMSDHGHNLVHSRRIPLADLLTRLGYRVRTKLEKPGDVVVPEFGVVTCAAIHTTEPESVARDVVGIEGVELAAYKTEENEVVVLSQSGRARIAESDAGFRYKPEFGDPLELVPILDELRRQQRVDADGFVNDRVLFDATASHVYPDAVRRLWRAFNGLVVNEPDVFLSIRDGYHCGNPTFSKIINLTAAHGNLRDLSSTAFAMTTAGALPDVMRMDDLKQAMSGLGIPLEQSKRSN